MRTKPFRVVAVIVLSVVLLPMFMWATVSADSGYRPPSDARCPQLHQLALDAGWPVHDLARLDYLMWRESRCDPQAFNRSDPNGGSRGLLQINSFWCKRHRWEPNPAGFLGALDVLTTCDELFDPATNLEAAHWIFTHVLFRHGCGWQPWTTRNTRWC